VLFNGGEASWSLAEGQWKTHDGWVEALGLRWNGEDGRRKGHPMSTGNPIWLIVPRELEQAIRAVTPQQSEGETRKPAGWDPD
jgi:hypothetical protein